MTSDPTLQAAQFGPPVLAERVGYLFAKLHHRCGTEAAAAFREAGLGLGGMHFGALSVIEAEGPMSQQELGDLVKKDRTSVVALVDELEGEGLVERHRNPADRRAYALEVTAAGRDWLARARPLMLAAEDALLADLDEGERAVLIDLLHRVLRSA